MGIRGGSPGGAVVDEHAPIVIGADGSRSFVARAVEATIYNARPPLTCCYYSYWADVPVSGAELFIRQGRAIVTYPTNDRLTIVVVLWPAGQFQEVRSGIEGHFLRTLEDHAPDLAARVRCGQRVEKFYGTADIPNFFRKPFGAGWALVGDAGYHKDALTAQGITDGFRDAELLADAVDEGLAGRRPLSESLASYERRRNEAAGPAYELTCQRATLSSPPPEMLSLLMALRGNQPDTDRFVGLDAGTTPIPEFFSRENIDRIVGSSVGHAPPTARASIAP